MLQGSIPQIFDSQCTLQVDSTWIRGFWSASYPPCHCLCMLALEFSNWGSRSCAIKLRNYGIGMALDTGFHCIIQYAQFNSTPTYALNRCGPAWALSKWWMVMLLQQYQMQDFHMHHLQQQPLPLAAMKGQMRWNLWRLSCSRLVLRVGLKLIAPSFCLLWGISYCFEEAMAANQW